MNETNNAVRKTVYLDEELTKGARFCSAKQMYLPFLSSLQRHLKRILTA